MNTPIRMSNENENERIDLDKYASMPIGGIFGVTFDQLFSDVERHEDGGVTTKPLNLSLTQMEAVKDLPKLIAELKRCYEELDRAQCFIQQGWVKIESYTDDGKNLFVDMEDDDGNRFSGWINRAQASE